MIASLLLATALGLSAGDGCTMRAPPLEAKRIQHDSTVRAVVVRKSEDSVSALLKDGSHLSVATLGCEHSGMQAALWVNDTTVDARTEIWFAKAVKLSRLAFGDSISSDLAAAIEAKEYTIEKNSSGLFINVELAGELFVAIRVQATAMGTTLYAEYIFP